MDVVKVSNRAAKLTISLQELTELYCKEYSDRPTPAYVCCFIQHVAAKAIGGKYRGIQTGRQYKTTWTVFVLNSITTQFRQQWIEKILDGVNSHVKLDELEGWNQGTDYEIEHTMWRGNKLEESLREYRERILQLALKNKPDVVFHFDIILAPGFEFVD